MADNVGTYGSAASGNPGLTYWDFIKRVGYAMGATRTPTGTNLTIVREIIEDGYQRFISPEIMPRDKMPHRWSFLFPMQTLSLVADTWEYNAPTDFESLYMAPTYSSSPAGPKIKIVSAVEIARRRAQSTATGSPYLMAIVPLAFVSQTGQRFGIQVYPTPSASDTLIYRYAVRTGMMAVPLCSGTATLGTTTLAYDSIEDATATFSTDGAAADGYVIITSENKQSSGIHQIASVESETKIKLDTTFAATETVAYEVHNELIYALGGGQYSQDLLEIMLAVMEERVGDGAGIHSRRAMERLYAAIQRDRMQSPDFIGGVRPSDEVVISSDVTYTTQ